MAEGPDRELFDQEWVEPEWLDRAIAWLNEKWGEDRACPYCGNIHWGIAEDLVELRPFDSRSPTVRAYPAFQVICRNCGHTALVNATTADVFHRGFRGRPPEGPE